MAETCLATLHPLITALRRRQDPERNFQLFRECVETHQEEILATLNLRWLVSICDTYADYGTPIERRNAMLISLFVNLIRIGDTYLYICDSRIDPDKLAQCTEQQVPLVGGLMTLAIDRQDTCLHLAKRLQYLLAETPFFLMLYHHMRDILLDKASLLGKFAGISIRPEMVFPPDAFLRMDNYGII